MSDLCDDWVEAAVELPLYFAQVREDPLLDLELVRNIGSDARVAMIASGGCTAALLAANEASQLLLVDANPAQLALTKLKLHLLDASPIERQRILGHSEDSAERRREQIEVALSAIDAPKEILGNLKTVAEYGLDFSGRYERLFAALQKSLRCSERELRCSLGSAPSETLRQELESAWMDVMELRKLIALFGEGATSNRRQEFASHFWERTLSAMQQPDAASNPYLSQVLFGSYPAECTAPWLHLPQCKPQTSCEFMNAPMTTALQECDRESFDLVHLSNILDWLTPEEAASTLAAAARALKPKGQVIVRQLNSNLDIPALGHFDWDAPRSASFLARDRSFFYRAVHLGTRA